MYFLNLVSATLVGSFVALSNAHPGADHKREAREHMAAVQAAHLPNDLSHCAEILRRDGHEQRAIERRMEVLRSEREQRGLPTEARILKARGSLNDRDAPMVLKTDHKSKTKFGPDSKHSEIFANTSCVLTPHITEGPYWVIGEVIHGDLREKDKGQKGVDVILDVQVVDISTCKPLPNIYVEFWHANATGIYSGIVASANGGTSDKSLTTATFARGIQPTSADGVARFTTFYAGHYGGRSTHYHIASHLNGSILANNTFTGTTVSHVGQIFFDQSLTSEIEKTAAYKPNNFPVTTNQADFIFAQAAATSDPVMKYSLLSDKVEDGLFGWLTLGVDSKKAAKNISPAGRYSADG
ncbi:Intradiol ring-cleavage dioxygenase, partial [Tricladium varicosporioides]